VNPTSTTLTKAQWDALVAEGTILEKDRVKDPKVVALPGGEFLKLLPVKHRLSTWGLFNPAKRFFRNAEELRQRGIQTITNIRIYYLPHKKDWAVHYQELPGRTYRDIFRAEGISDEQEQQFVEFVMSLHMKGIYFRSLHLGNVVIMPDGSLGLIDILDCYFRKKLFSFQIQRNLKQMMRYPDTEPLARKIAQQYKG
jgi:hypothetical protein